MLAIQYLNRTITTMNAANAAYRVNRSMAKRPRFIPAPNADRMRELFDYDPCTGVLSWRVSTNSRVKVGDEFGCLNKRGYRVGNVDGRLYVAHRLIWVWMTGCDPIIEVDHRNTVESDNRWENLRLATGTQNMGNVRLSSRSKSGLKGVTWDVRNKKWMAKVTKSGQQHYLGLFAVKSDAGAAYMRKAIELFGEFARAA